LYLNTLFFVEIIKIDKNSKKSLNFHRGICVGKTGLAGVFYCLSISQIRYTSHLVGKIASKICVISAAWSTDYEASLAWPDPCLVPVFIVVFRVCGA
ncbi:hypothetical protein, partial [Vibrio fluvialis]|uniref:hypothetical protein n=1 Tax=Vibrio fluvialis TaxID=676 RepID=UPI001F2924BE